MKKLMMALAVATCAVGLQAASLAWSSASYKLVGSDGSTVLKSLESGAIVLAYIGTTADYGLDHARVLDTDYNITSSGMPTAIGKVTGTYEFTYGESGTIQNGDVLAVLFQDSNGDLYAIRNADNTADMLLTYEVAGLSNDSWRGNGGFTFASSNFQATAVPEPTSGLLLLLGVAGLALRRKNA